MKLSQEGLCSLIGINSFEPYATAELGYGFFDLDDNGVEELLIGIIDGGEGYRGMIYDLYTIKEGEITQMLSSLERIRYYICNDNIIAYEGSGGAGSSNYSFYKLEKDDGNLTLTDAVIYEDGYGVENPWYYFTAKLVYQKDLNSAEHYRSIDQEEAMNIINSRPHIELPLTPFSQYETFNF